MADLSLTAAVLNLNGIVENDSWSIDLTITSDGSPMDLTGATVVAKILAAEVSYPLTTAIADAAGGKLTVSMTQSPLIEYGTWALRVNDRTMVRGSVNGLPDVLK